MSSGKVSIVDDEEQGEEEALPTLDDYRSSDSELAFWDDSSEEDPDGERGRIGWVEKTKKEIREAEPHEDSFWNCWHCGKRCLGCSFVSYPEDKKLGAPAVNVHVLDCALAYRKKYNLVWKWEKEPGVAKEGYRPDGLPVGIYDRGGPYDPRNKGKDAAN